MPRLATVLRFLREVLGSRQFPREPESDLVMADVAQVQAYAEAGRIDGVISATLPAQLHSGEAARYLLCLDEQHLRW